jgi:ATP-binding cassette, subfamily B, bacterial
LRLSHPPVRVAHTLVRYWQLLARYLRPQRARMLVLALALGGAIATQVLAPLVTGRFIDRATSGAALDELLVLALLTIGLALVRQGLGVAETYAAEHVSWEATNALRADLLSHLLKLDAGFHTTHTPGELIERTDGDVTTLARFFSRLVLSVAGNGVLVLAVLVLLAVVDWRVGLGLGAFVALALLAMLRIRAAATPAWAAERAATAEFYGFLGDYLAGAEDVRASGAVAFVLHRCALQMRAWLAATRRAQMMGYALVASSQGLFALGTLAAFAVSAVLFASGALTLGTVYLIFRYTEMLRQPIEQIRNEIQDLQQADASIGRVEMLLATTPRIADGPGDVLPPGPLTVAFEGVSFTYNDTASNDELFSVQRSAFSIPVLTGVSFTVHPGRVLGIIGRTGSGKTTLTRLLLRFYDPAGGIVRLGGVDIRSVRLAAVRERIGLVTQDVQLFDATLRDNLTLFDADLPDERLHTALDALGMQPWVRGLPHGLDTRLGAGGVGLSAGQAQLLACARIFLRDPDVIVLDEASARLDPATERLVHAAFERLLAGRTGIVIAHRLDTVAFADDILVLADGRVREYGPRHELAADSASYFAGLLRVAAGEITS